MKKGESNIHFQKFQLKPKIYKQSNTQNKMPNKINIPIPKELAAKLEQKIKQTNFDSINKYIIYILEQVTSEENFNYENRQAYTEEEEAELKKELSDMGYL